MARIGVALDLGTSSYKAQKIDLDSGEIIRTSMTMHNPLPGTTVLDQNLFALTWHDKAHELVIKSVETLFGSLRVTPRELERIAICGNVVQMSVFQSIPVDDLPYSYDPAADDVPAIRDRGARIIDASEIRGLEKYEHAMILIPPSAHNRIGADKLALLLKSGMLDGDHTSLAIDYGVGTKMVLKVGDAIYSGSVISGTGLGGQGLSYGSVSKPLSICDVEWEGAALRTYVHDNDMHCVKAGLFDPVEGTMLEDGPVKPFSFSGAGSIALIKEGLDAGIIRPPEIATPDHTISLRVDLKYDEDDLSLAGSGIGSVRAGYISLCTLAGVDLDDIRSVYTSGALGTYVNPKKALALGLLPQNTQTIRQFGNTSLHMARDILIGDEDIFELEKITESVTWKWVIFNAFELYNEALVCEYAYWREGLSAKLIETMRKERGIPVPRVPDHTPAVEETRDRDIEEMGKEGLKVIKRMDTILRMKVEGCTGCFCCTDVCKHNAITIESSIFKLKTDLCDGLSCQKCVRSCMGFIIDWNKLHVELQDDDESRWMPTTWKHCHRKGMQKDL
jgi:methylamine methyltransferase corrinoid protein reductive activase